MKRIVYYIAYGFWFVLSLLPFCVLYVLSDIIYYILRYVVRYRRHVIRKNLSRSFPEKSKHELRRIEKGFYHYFSDYLVESVKLLTISERQMRKRMTFTGTELLNQTAADGQSIAVYLGHYGNWEWMSSLPYWVSDKIQCTQIYHPLEDIYFDQLFKRIRERHGAVGIKMNETLRRIAEYRKQKQVIIVGYLSDQVPMWTNMHHWLTFLNQDTPVLTGAERIIKASGHAAFYGDIRRLRRGYYNCEFKLITREPQQTGEWEITDSYFRELEKTIRREPQYWLWSHNRWKRTREEFNRRFMEVDGRIVKRETNE